MFRKIISRQTVISKQDLAIFFRQFATLMASGIPLIESMTILESSQQNIRLTQLIYHIKIHLLSGQTLFQAFQQQQRYFDNLTCQLIHIGEHTGNLDFMLNTIATHKEKQLALIAKIRHALFYPLFILSLACCIALGMFIFIIPRFADLFQHANLPLPFLTACLFKSALHLQQVGLYYLAIIMAIIFYLLRSQNNNWKDYLRNKMYQNRYAQKFILANFARQLACAFSAGIPILDAITLIAKTTDIPEFAALLYQLSQQLQSGLYLHVALASHLYFPPYMSHMLKIGEETGCLDQMLHKIADHYSDEIERISQRCHQLLEPLIMLVLGVLIGGLVIGMYLPIFNLGSSL